MICLDYMDLHGLGCGAATSGLLEPGQCSHRRVSNVVAFASIRTVTHMLLAKASYGSLCGHSTDIIQRLLAFQARSGEHRRLVDVVFCQYYE